MEHILILLICWKQGCYMLTQETTSCIRTLETYEVEPNHQIMEAYCDGIRIQTDL